MESEISLRAVVTHAALPNALARRATTRTLTALALIGLAFNLVIFPWRTARLREMSGVAMPILDIRFAYTPGTLFDIATGLGERGRQFYALSELTADLVYPLLYSSLFSLLLERLLPRAFPDRAGWRQLALLPFGALIFDYGENAALATILLGFPGTMRLAPIASLFTSVKWIFGGASILMIAICGLKLLASRVRWGDDGQSAPPDEGPRRVQSGRPSLGGDHDPAPTTHVIHPARLAHAVPHREPGRR
jgi:hypothetical protein